MELPWMIAYIIQWAVIAILLILFYQTLKLVGEYIQKVDRMERHAKQGFSFDRFFPEYQAESISTPGKVDTTRGTGHQFLLFVSPTCMACEEVLTNLHRIPLPQHQEVAVICMKDEKHSHLKYLPILKERRIPMALDSDLFFKLGIPSLPYGIVIDAERNILTYGEAGSMKDIQEMIDISLRQENAS
jgi:hypothetical protein